MITVSSAHFNEHKHTEFNLLDWAVNLHIFSQVSYESLIKNPLYCLHSKQEYGSSETLLYRTIRIGEVLSIINIDAETLLFLLLVFPTDTVLITEKVLWLKISQLVVLLVRGIYDMGAIRCLQRIKSFSAEQVDHPYRIMLPFILDDFRSVIIKCAERIACLREIKNARKNQHILVIKKHNNVRAFFKKRLGTSQLNWELEDYCFQYLYPSEYNLIVALLHERRADRERYIKKFVSNLCKLMKKKGIKAEVYGRPKHIYSIWRKMKKKNLTFDELSDVRAVRVVAECIQDCYIALEIIHALFRYFPDKFDDYIANPKKNGYQSIHTVVLGPDSKTIEIQIRTKKMHEDAELGMAAHWKYKKGIGETRFIA